MRDVLGLVTLRQMHTNYPDLVVVVLTAYADTALNMHFREMGVNRILMKDIGSSELLAELRATYASAHFLDSQES